MAIDEDPAYLEMQPSTRSFRLVAECPLAGEAYTLCSLRTPKHVQMLILQ